MNVDSQNNISYLIIFNLISDIKWNLTGISFGEKKYHFVTSSTCTLLVLTIAISCRFLEALEAHCGSATFVKF